MIQDHCPVCTAASGSVVGTKEGLRVLRCIRCTARYSEHAPGTSQLADMYGESYFHGAAGGYPAYEADERMHRSRARGYLRNLRRHVAAPGSLLDVGCATGFFLDEARRSGWRVRGYEVSEWAAGVARTRRGLDVTVAPFPSERLHGQQYDAVTFLNVLEHLADVRRAEQSLRAIVAPGGIVALETWDVDALIVQLLGMYWHQYCPRRTPVYLNRRSLTTLFAPAHWTLIEYRVHTKWITLSHGLHALGLLQPPSPSSNGQGLRHHLLGQAVPYRLGDLVWAVLRRKPDDQ